MQVRAGALADAMREIPGLLSVSLSVDEPQPEYRIEVDRERANELGLDIGVIAMTVRPLFASEAVTRWEDPSGEEREVVVQVAPELRTSPADLAALPVATTHYDDAGMPIIVPLGRVAAAGLDLPPGYEVRLGGETEVFEETVGYVVEAIILSIILIYLILASQFESLSHPIAIMVSLPLSLIGVLVALLLTGDTLNMMSMIGVILLMGLVTKNAILLVDNANERRSLGSGRHTALVEAGMVRLRPIMMTTAAMILGMMPIALALSEGSGFRAPMARAVIGGLITSTLLTLLVVPVAYTYLDDMASWIKDRLVSDERMAMIQREQESSGMKPEPVWGDAAEEAETEARPRAPAGG